MKTSKAIQFFLKSTNILREQNETWQLRLKLHKDHLRNQLLCGIEDNDYDAHTITNVGNSDNVQEVVVGLMDMTAQEQIIKKFKLEDEQKRAFLIITDHLEQKSFLNQGIIRII